MKTPSLPFEVNWRKLPFTQTQAAALFSYRGNLNTAQQLHMAGAITTAELRWYVFFWTWSAPRFSDTHNAAAKQYRCHKAITWEGLERRFERCRRLHEKWFIKRFGLYLIHQLPAHKQTPEPLPA
jgi:hypothetical protein